jgi:hypothetical protein
VRKTALSLQALSPWGVWDWVWTTELSVFAFMLTVFACKLIYVSLFPQEPFLEEVQDRKVTVGAQPEEDSFAAVVLTADSAQGRRGVNVERGLTAGV